MKDTAIIIGRFSPIHYYHIDNLFKQANEYKKVIVLIGSSYQAATFKNPWSFEERREFILWSLAYYGIDTRKFIFKALKDYPYSDIRWVLQVQKLVTENAEGQVTLIGTMKDESSWYLKMFPMWKSDIKQPKVIIGATDIRKALFEDNLKSIENLVSDPVYQELYLYQTTDQFKNLQSEYFHAKNKIAVLAFKDKDGNLKEAPYKPIAYCVDNIVTWRGHILMIERKAIPGKGLWALPGGHLNPNEWVKDAAIRELNEETSIYFYLKGSKRRLTIDKNWCKKEQQFDDPGRSLFGRKITTAFHWVIPDEYEVFIEARDDAAKAKWITFYEVLELMDNSIFEDHQSIIAHMILGY